MLNVLSSVSFPSFAHALDLEVVLALRLEILIRVLGPTELLVVLADVEDLEDRRSIRTGEHDRNLPVPVHAIAELLVRPTGPHVPTTSERRR